MRDSFPILIQLQKIDLEIHALEQQRTGLPKSLAERKATAEQKKAALAAKQEEFKKARMDADRREVDLKEQEAKIAKLQLQLNTVKTNKEYSVLQSEIAGIKADCGLIEDDILKHMSRVEAVGVEVKGVQAELDAAQGHLDELAKQVDAALAELDGRIGQKRTARDATAKNVGEEILAIYNRIQKHKPDGRALARIEEGGEHGVCGACYMEPNTQDINLIKGRRAVVNCRTCGRILYSD